MKKETIMELLGDLLNQTKNEGPSLDEGIKIVVLQRGWVVIGRLFSEGEYNRLEDAYIIRTWGTDKGLGQLALEGKQSNTKLDKTGTVRFHKLTSVAIIDCKESVWKKEL